MNRARALINSEKGTMALEFTLLLPAMLLVIFSTIELGSAWYAKQIMITASREGARLGAIYTIDGVTNEWVEQEVEDMLQDTSFPLSANVIVSGADGVTGDPVRVEVRADYDLPILSSLVPGVLGTITLSSITVMRHKKKKKMRRKGPLLFTFVAVVLALTAAWGSQRWLHAQARQAAAVRVPEAKVVVAARDLASGQKLEGFHLTTISWPRSSLPPGHFSKTKKLVGRVMAGPVVKGEVLLPSKLAKEGLSGGLSAVVPPGARAVTVRVNEVIGVAGFLQSGDRVDVYVTVNTGQYTKDPVSRMILQDVKVLAVGEQVQEQTGPSKGPK